MDQISGVAASAQSEFSTIFPCWTGHRGRAELFSSRDWSPQSLSPQQHHTCSWVAREPASTKQNFFPKCLGPVWPAWEVPGLFKPNTLSALITASQQLKIKKQLSWVRCQSHHPKLHPATSSCPYKSVIIKQKEKYYCKYLSGYAEASKKIFSHSLFLRFQDTAKYTPEVWDESA